MSFDVISLFTNVPLEDTINVILRIYEKKEFVSNLSSREMRELLYLLTKNVYFMFNNKIYIQNDSVVMGSLLGSVLANMFMVEVEAALIANFSSKLCFWKRFVDDSICL